MRNSGVTWEELSPFPPLGGGVLGQQVCAHRTGERDRQHEAQEGAMVVRAHRLVDPEAEVIVPTREQ